MPNRSHPIHVVALAALLAGCDATDFQAPSQAPTPRAIQPLSTAVRVEVAPVTMAQLDQASAATGVVAAFRKTTVAAEIGGKVIRRRVEPGDLVETGAPLIDIDADRATLRANQAKSDADARRVDVKQAEHDYRRSLRLRMREVISQDILDNHRFAYDRARSQLASALAALKTAERELRDASVVAPFAGSAEQVHVQEGDYLAPGMQVATIADFSKVRVVAGITANEAAYLAVGARATVAFEALGGQAMAGEVHSIGRIGDAVSGTYPVEIWLSGNTSQLREGMIATVSLPLPAQNPHLVVPRSALFRNSGGLFVYAVIDNKAQLRPVRVGRSNGQVTEILDGVSEGDAIITEGQFALRDGARVVVNP